MSTQDSQDKKVATLARIIECLEGGMTTTEAARAAGVNRRTILNWRHADPEFDLAVRDAMSSVDDSVEAVTYRNAIDPDPAHNVLRMFWLKSRRPEVYRDAVRQEMSGANGDPLKIVIQYADVQPDAAPAPPIPEGDPFGN